METEFLEIESYTIASDVGDRDGIGVEFYCHGKMIMEIFRDDTKRTREVTLYKKELPIDLVEKAIQIFKQEIPEEFED
ncbi:conserved hypothetical protein [Alteromonas infernus]